MSALEYAAFGPHVPALEILLAPAGCARLRPQEMGSHGTPWRRDTGVVFARSWEDSRGLWIDACGVALYHFGSAGKQCVAYVVAASSATLAVDFYLRSVVPVLLEYQGIDVMHASAVRAKAGIVAFCGLSGVGKSTVAYGLSTRGFAPWSDDAVAFRWQDSGAWSIPLPSAPRLRGPALAYFGTAAQSVQTTSDTAATNRTEEPVPLHAVVVLDRATAVDARVCLEPLPPSIALSALLPHAYWYDLHRPPAKTRLARSYLRLVVEVQLFRAVVAPGFDQFPVLLDMLSTAFR